jgi:hypothetical protein
MLIFRSFLESRGLGSRFHTKCHAVAHSRINSKRPIIYTVVLLVFEEYIIGHSYMIALGYWVVLQVRNRSRICS